jgi:hypothetical protein
VTEMWILCCRLRIAITALALVLPFSVTPGHAVTCEEVRGLSTTELGHWAGRLQVSPTYLAELLEEAFCTSESKRDRVIAPDRRRRLLKSI